jgi:hypothetical protein
VVTRSYAQSTSQLSDVKWDTIIKAAIMFIPASKSTVFLSQEDLVAELFPNDVRALLID